MKDILKCLNFKILIFCIFVLYGSCNLFAYCEIAGTQTRYDYRDGVCLAYHCASGSPTWLGSVSSSYCSGGGTQPSGCKLGDMQYKPDGECETIEQSCCYNYKWSGWGKVCPNPGDECTSSQCWNGSSCTNKPSGTQYDGKCYYTWTSCNCVRGSGWSCSGRKYQDIKIQKGTWTIWNDAYFYGTKPTTTCQPSTKNYIYNGGSDANEACIVQKNALGVSGTGTWEGSCRVIGNCWEMNYSGSGQYNCQVRELNCYVEQRKCA